MADAKSKPGGLPRYVGQSVPRREDRRLLLGQGQFVADIQLPGMLHAAFARSSHPHALITSVDLTRVRSAEGVIHAASGAEIFGVLPPIGGMQLAAPKAYRERVKCDILIPDQPLMPHDRVRHVGEAYALVVAANRYLAEDALELIEAEFEPLPVAANAQAALKDGAPLIHEQLGRNWSASLQTRKGDGANALARAPHRLRRRFVHHRYAAMPLECRGVVAEYDRRTDSITVWSSTHRVEGAVRVPPSPHRSSRWGEGAPKERMEGQTLAPHSHCATSAYTSTASVMATLPRSPVRATSSQKPVESDAR